MQDRLELYRSSNGDAWFLALEPHSRELVIIREPNVRFGGLADIMRLPDFLLLGNGPEQQAFIALVGTLVPADGGSKAALQGPAKSGNTPRA